MAGLSDLSSLIQGFPAHIINGLEVVKNRVSALFDSLARNLIALFWSLVNHTINGLAHFFSFIGNMLWAHFHLAGQYLVPIEEEIFKTDTRPKKLSEISILGQIIFTIIPVIPITWLVSLTIAPLIYNSVILLVKTFITATNLPLTDVPKYQLPDPQGKMAWYRILFFSIPGILLGLLGSVFSVGLAIALRFVASSFMQFIRRTVLIAMKALPKEEGTLERIGLNQERTFFQKYLFGVPGDAFGILPGLLGFVLIGAARILRESFYTGNEFLVKSAKWVLEDEDKERLQNAIQQDPDLKFFFKEDRDPFDRNILGFLGFFYVLLFSPVSIGAAGIFRTVKNTSLVFEHHMARAVHRVSKFYYVKSFVGENDLPEIVPFDENMTKTSRYVFGLPGWFTARLLSAGLFLGLGAYNLGAHALETIFFLNASLLNVLWVPVTHTDERTSYQKYVTGILGILPALLVMPFTVAAAGAIHSFKSVPYGFWKVTNVALPSDDKKQIDDPRPRKFRYGLGGLGLLLGGFVGIFGFSAVGIVRIIKHFSAVYVFFRRIAKENMNIAKDTFCSMLDIVLPDDMEFNREIPKRDLLTYFLGISGLVAGGVSGTLGFMTVAFFRSLSNSMKTTINLFSRMTNVAILDKEGKIPLVFNGRKPPLAYGFGFFGIFTGLFFGVFGFGGALSWEVLKNTIYTTFYLTLWSINKVLEKPLSEEKDKREDLLPRFLGSLGFLLSVFTIPIAVIVTASLRTIVETALTTQETFMIVYQRFFNSDFEQKDRTPVSRYGFGFLGLFLGAVIGSATVFLRYAFSMVLKIALLARDYLEHNWISFKSLRAPF